MWRTEPVRPARGPGPSGGVVMCAQVLRSPVKRFRISGSDFRMCRPISIPPSRIPLWLPQFSDLRPYDLRPLPAFTLVEMLVAMAITLVMMGAVVTLFANVSNSVRDPGRGRDERPTPATTPTNMLQPGPRRRHLPRPHLAAAGGEPRIHRDHRGPESGERERPHRWRGPADGFEPGLTTKRRSSRPAVPFTSKTGQDKWATDAAGPARVMPTMTDAHGPQ